MNLKEQWKKFFEHDDIKTKIKNLTNVKNIRIDNLYSQYYNALYKGFEDIYNLFPFMKEYSLDSIYAYDKQIKEEYSDEKYSKEIDDACGAYLTKQLRHDKTNDTKAGNNLLLNAKYFNNVNDTIYTYYSGNKIENEKYLYAVTIHENIHNMISMLYMKTHNISDKKRLNKPLYKYPDYYDWKKDFCKGVYDKSCEENNLYKKLEQNIWLITDYSAKSYEEALADAFADFFANDIPSSLSESIVENTINKIEKEYNLYINKDITNDKLISINELPAEIRDERIKELNDRYQYCFDVSLPLFPYNTEKEFIEDYISRLINYQLCQHNGIDGQLPIDNTCCEEYAFLKTLNINLDKRIDVNNFDITKIYKENNIIEQYPQNIKDICFDALNTMYYPDKSTVSNNDIINFNKRFNNYYEKILQVDKHYNNNGLTSLFFINDINKNRIRKTSFIDWNDTIMSLKLFVNYDNGFFTNEQNINDFNKITENLLNYEFKYGNIKEEDKENISKNIHEIINDNMINKNVEEDIEEDELD